MTDTTRTPDHLYRTERARQYDTDLVIRWVAGVRRRAVDALCLQPGQTVLDIACGTGLNLQALSRRVGPTGRVIGVDISPEMLDISQGRIDHHGLTNVQLVNAAVESATLPTDGDAALLSFAHDVLHSPQATRQSLAYLRPGARVVAGGAMQQWFPGPLGWWLPKLLARRYSGDRPPMARPYESLAPHVDIVEVRRLPTYLWTMYVFVGTIPATRAPAAS